MTARLYTPDGVPDWEPGLLTRPEKQWLEQRRLEAERAAAEAANRPVRSATSKLHRAIDRYSLEAGWVADALHHATATLPPGPGKKAGRGGPGHANPTSSVFWSTLNAIDHATTVWAHLAAPCGDETHSCPPSIIELADILNVELDPASIVDELLGVPPASQANFAAVINRAAAWHSKAASKIADGWHGARNGGAERTVLEQTADIMDGLSRRMLWLAGSIAQWSNRTERRCACGCGGAAPPVGEGATAQACRKRQSRAAEQERQQAS